MLFAVEMYEKQEKSPYRVDVILYVLVAIVSIYTIIQVDIAGMMIPLSHHSQGGFLTNPENDVLLSQVQMCRVYDTQDSNESWIQKSDNQTDLDETCGLMTRKKDTDVDLGWLFFRLHYYRVRHEQYGDAHYFSGSAVGVRTMFWRDPEHPTRFLGAYIHTGFGLMYTRGVTHHVAVQVNAHGDLLGVQTSNWQSSMGFPHYAPGFRLTFRLVKLYLGVAIKMILQILCLIEICILIRLMWTHQGSIFSQGLPAMACSYRTTTQVGLLVAQTVIALEEGLAVYGSWVIQDWNMTGISDAIYMANFLRGVVLVLLLINDYTIGVGFTIASIECGRILLTLLLVPATMHIAHVMFVIGLTTFLESHNYAFASVLGHSILLVCIAIIYLTIAAIVCRLEDQVSRCSRTHEYRLEGGDLKFTYRKMNLW